MSISVADYKKMTQKKNKFHAVKRELDHIIFGSKDEAEFYQLLKLDKTITHIDCHVPVTLPGGIRLNIDFIVWTGRYGEAIEAKGYVTNGFNRMRKLFDAFHPLSPLRVVRKTKKGWENL